MIRSALVSVAVLMASPLTARAGEGSCAEESDAASRAASINGRDRSLDPPSDPTAAEHVKAANRAYRALQFDDAIAEYTAAALVDDAPVILYNLGQTYRATKEYEKAIRQYRLFLDRGNPGPELRALVECHVAMMDAELEQSAAAQPPTGPADDLGRRDDEVDEPPAAPTWYEDGVGWGIVGGGVVGVAVGGFLLLDAAGLEDDANREDRQHVRDGLRDKASTRRTVGLIVGAAGAVALAVGVVKLAITPSASRDDGRRTSLILGAGYVGLAGRF